MGYSLLDFDLGSVCTGGLRKLVVLDAVARSIVIRKWKSWGWIWFRHRNSRSIGQSPYNVGLLCPQGLIQLHRSMVGRLVN